jgi:hypothetical protein
MCYLGHKVDNEKEDGQEKNEDKRHSYEKVVVKALSYCANTSWDLSSPKT